MNSLKNVCALMATVCPINRKYQTLRTQGVELRTAFERYCKPSERDISGLYTDQIHEMLLWRQAHIIISEKASFYTPFTYASVTVLIFSLCDLPGRQWERRKRLCYRLLLAAKYCL